MIGLTAIVVGRDEIPWRRRAPCPECARLTVLCADQNDTNRQAARSLREANAALALAKLDADSLANGLKEQQARAEAAEARCREAARGLRGHHRTDMTSTVFEAIQAAIASLEARP